MNITPKAGPTVLPVATASSTPSGMEARERAIQRLTAQPAQAQEHPVANPSQVSPEEMSAVRAPSATLQDNKGVAPEPHPEAPVKEEETPLSSQYAILARKEKALRARSQQQEQTLRSREAALAAREEAIKAKDGEYATKYIPKDRLQQDTINTLLEAGISYDKITELMLSQPQDNISQHPVVRRLEAKIAELEGNSQKAAKSFEDNQTQQYQQALNQIRQETKDLVKSDPVTYEAIQATGSVKDVVDLIEQTFKADGVLLSVEEAAKEVEEYLTEEATKLSRLKKIQQRLAQPKQGAPEAKVPSQTKAQQPQQTLKTLTNSVGSSGKLSAKERAVLAFKGELKG